MKKDKISEGSDQIVLSIQKELPKLTMIFPIAIYLLFYLGTVRSAHSGAVIMLGNSSIPVSSLTGVFSSLGNLCLVIIVVLYKKTGFLLSLLVVLLQFPGFFVRILLQHNLASIPGLFSNLFTIVMLMIIYNNHKKMEREQRRLQNLFRQTATALVNAIDAKDTYTHGHSARVARYSKKLAEMNFKSPEECEEVYYAALLHDVGKIGIPESIINKSGKLTAEEYELIKHHPALGAQILQTINEFPYLSIGACGHHERYDGKGYPYGLKGTDIPEIARIISVADAYDAMSSKRSYRDPIPQPIVREEIVKGTGTQFDPVYARLMLHLIDLDTEYDMREREMTSDLTGKDVFINESHRDEISDGILTTRTMTILHLTVSPTNNLPGRAPNPSMILFDSIDGRVHDTEKEIANLDYCEYGEIWFDGKTTAGEARKIQTSVTPTGSKELTKPGEYRIEAVKIKDHLLIRTISAKQTVETIIALPDSSRYAYIGITGEHCLISEVRTEKAKKEFPEDYIPRIAEAISYVDVPAGDIPNIQIDAYRTASSEGIAVKNGLQISFHAKSLPTAKLVWHCPYINVFCSDDGKVNGNNYRELAFLRFDGEFWECDPSCTTELNSNKNETFKGWDAWKQFNLDGYDTTVSFEVNGNRITMITENAGISIKGTVITSGITDTIYVAVTGDQIAVTNIRIR